MSPILGVLLFVVVTLAAPPSLSPNPSPVEHCSTNSECPSNLCCLLGPSRYTIPACMPFQQKAEQCRVNAKTVTTNLTYPDNSRLELKDVHYILCPCADGLSCNPNDGICN